MFSLSRKQHNFAVDENYRQVLIWTRMWSNLGKTILNVENAMPIREKK
jgi:hypothetical protein